MNVLHVNNVDLQGRRFNGYDLLDDLHEAGIAARQAVLLKQSSNVDVVPILAGHADEQLAAAVYTVEDRHGMNGLLVPWGTVLSEMPEYVQADVVHHHLIHNNVISLTDLPELFAGKPSVWTFHDAWPVTGHCIQPGTCDGWLSGCQTCAHLDRPLTMSRDTSHQMWKLKQSVFARLDVDIVVASQFMFDLVKRSPLTSHFDRVHLIPFGIRAETFLEDSEKTASRERLGIPQGDFVIMFRAAEAEFKGFARLLEALKLHPPTRPTTLLAVGTKDLLHDVESQYNVVDLGWVEDDSTYPQLFSACDVFAMPSLAEGFGLMALEAMAAGRPVVCFADTAPASVTHAPECGIAVPYGDSAALRAALDALADDPADARRRGELGRELARSEYSHEDYVGALMSLYESVLSRKGSGVHSRGTASIAGQRGSEGTQPLAGVRIGLVFPYSLSHYSRLLEEIAVLQAAGAVIEVLTSEAAAADVPEGVSAVVAPLSVDEESELKRFQWASVKGPRSLVSVVRYQRMQSRMVADRQRTRAREFGALAHRSDILWVIDEPLLPFAVKAVQGTSTRVVYETVDLVPEYLYGGEKLRHERLAEERRLLHHVDGFITACDSYADYYMAKYGDGVLTRRPVVRDNMPARIVESIRPSEKPLRFLFLGSLMFDRPVLELIEAIARTSADATITFQGKNYLGDEPSRLIEELGLGDRVSILEPCAPDQIVDVASEYDVGIVALKGENENERWASTSKLFTYMAAGLAVLGSDLPGISRVVTEYDNGRLVEGMGATAWAASIDEVASMPGDQIDAMKQRSLDAARQHSWERQRDPFVGEFVRALGTR